MCVLVTVAMIVFCCMFYWHSAKPPAIQKAVFDIVMDPDGKHVQVQREVTDGAELQKLVMFFPHLGEGRESWTHGGWKSFGEIKFTCADGKLIHVMTDYEHWTEGPGDWPVAPEFSAYIKELLAKPATQPATAPAGGLAKGQ